MNIQGIFQVELSFQIGEATAQKGILGPLNGTPNRLT